MCSFRGIARLFPFTPRYGSPVALAAGGSYSVSGVVAALGKVGQGTLVVKYSGGGQAPLVSTRAYFRPKVNPGNISYGRDSRPTS